MQETFEEVPQRIPLAERNNFQVFLMREMLDPHASPEDEIAWANRHGEIISAIIDDNKYEYIRTMIMRGDLKSAADAVKKLMKA